jgi:hypothetical protein
MNPAGRGETYEMWQSVSIEVDGSFVGALVRQDGKLRFIATDIRVAEMDQTLWPAMADARRAAEQMVRTGRIQNFDLLGLEY